MNNFIITGQLGAVKLHEETASCDALVVSRKRKFLIEVVAHNAAAIFLAKQEKQLVLLHGSFTTAPNRFAVLTAKWILPYNGIQHLNTGMITGRIGTDPVLRRMENNNQVLNFSLAVPRAERGLASLISAPGLLPVPDWISIGIWGNNATEWQRHLQKNRRISVAGEITGDQQGHITIRVQQLTLIDSVR